MFGYMSAAIYEFFLVFNWCLSIAVALHYIKEQNLAFLWTLDVNLNNNKY